MIDRRPSRKAKGPHPAPYRYCQDQIAAWRERVVTEASRMFDRREVQRAFLLGRCYDSIRMCSYQDVSIFKRLFFLKMAAETASELGLVKH